MLCGVTATLGSNPSATAAAARPHWGRAVLLCLRGVCGGLVAPTDLRPLRGLPARSPSAPRASLGASTRCPARPCRPRGGLHTGGIAAASGRAELGATGSSTQAMRQPRCQARARRLVRTEETNQFALRHASATHTTPIATQRIVGTLS